MATTKSVGEAPQPATGPQHIHPLRDNVQPSSPGEVKISYIVTPPNLDPPPGYIATVILRFIGRENNARMYAVLLVVEHNKEAQQQVTYKPYNDDIRCDLRSLAYLCPSVLEPHLKSFSNNPSEGDPPVIKRTQ